MKHVVNHRRFDAVQYEFYIPESIWNHPAVVRFRQSLESVEQAATIFASLGGLWQGEPESTRIFRVILRVGRHDPDPVRDALIEQITALMRELNTSADTAQDAFMFTETPLRLTMVGKVE